VNLNTYVIGVTMYFGLKGHIPKPVQIIVEKCAHLTGEKEICKIAT